MSFLITALGSYGFPRNDDPFSTSCTALAILCQMIGARLSKPICRQCSWIDAWSGMTVWRPLFFRRDRQTSPTTQISRPPGVKRLKATLPHLVQFAQKSLVIGHVAKLPLRIAIFFQGPIGRGGEHKMHRFRLQLHGPGVAEVKIMAGGNPLDGLFDQRDQPGVLGDGRNGRLRIGQRR